jgi:hypothetical protein
LSGTQVDDGNARGLFAQVGQVSHDQEHEFVGAGYGFVRYPFVGRFNVDGAMV